MALNVCVLRSGGDFKPEHVNRLAAMVPDLICLTDMQVEGVKTIPLQHDWPKWWSKINIFSPDIESDIMYFDLDTTVLKMPVMPTKTTVLRDFTDHRVIGSGLMFIKHEDKAQVWDDFVKNARHIMDTCKHWPNYGDQGYLRRFFIRAQKWQDIAKVYSYKMHGFPDDAEVVCFHGKPRPWDIE